MSRSQSTRRDRDRGGRTSARYYDGPEEEAATRYRNDRYADDSPYGRPAARHADPYSPSPSRQSDERDRDRAKAKAKAPPPPATNGRRHHYDGEDSLADEDNDNSRRYGRPHPRPQQQPRSASARGDRRPESATRRRGEPVAMAPAGGQGRPLEGPLRRQSTQRPPRRISPHAAGRRPAEEEQTPRRRWPESAAISRGATPGYSRREVAPAATSPRRRERSTPMREAPIASPRRSARYSAAAVPESRALVVVRDDDDDDNYYKDARSPYGRRPRSPRPRSESVDGIVVSPRPQLQRSPRRSARERGNTPRPRPSSHGGREAAAAAATPNTRSRSVKRREPEAKAAPERGRSASRRVRRETRERDEEEVPLDTGRYVSPPEPRRSRSRPAAAPAPAASPRRHRSTVRRDSDDTTATADKEGRQPSGVCSRSTHRREEEGRAAPRAHPQVPPLNTHATDRSRHSAGPTSARGSGSRDNGGSTFLRPPSQRGSARGRQTADAPPPPPNGSSSRRSSGIEVLSISPRPRHGAAYQQRYEPTPTPPQVDQFCERIVETKEWIAEMKQQVARDVAREERARNRRSGRPSDDPRGGAQPPQKEKEREQQRRSRRGDNDDDEDDNDRTERERDSYLSRSSRRQTQAPPPLPHQQQQQRQTSAERAAATRSSIRRLEVDSIPTSTTATNDSPRLHHSDGPAPAARHSAAPAHPRSSPAPRPRPESARRSAPEVPAFRHSVDLRTSTGGGSARNRAGTTSSQPTAASDRPSARSSSRRCRHRPATPPSTTHRSSRHGGSSSRHHPRVEPAAAPRPPTPSPPRASSPPQKRRPASPTAEQRAQLLRVIDAVNSTMEEDPIFSFQSFLDGNTFHSLRGLCNYNMALAERLSDDELFLMRAVVFGHDETFFAELLYGDDLQAELSVIEAALGSSREPTARWEMRRLQSEAVARFTDKGTMAREKLLGTADGRLGDAVREAAEGLERGHFDDEAGADGHY